MDLRTALIIAGMLAPTFTRFRYGARFWQHGNILLGAEWIILGVSAANFVFWSVWGLELAHIVTMNRRGIPHRMAAPSGRPRLPHTPHQRAVFAGERALVG